VPSPLDDRFWKEEADRLWAAVGAFLASLLMEGAKIGQVAIPPTLRILVNWDVFDERMIRSLNDMRTKWWDGLTLNTQKLTKAEIDDWLRSGERLPALEERFITKGIFSPERAGRIAVTEVTRTISRGNSEIWGSTGFIRQGVWHTGNDDRVCQVCASLDGTHWDIEDVDAHPPTHVNCRCYLTPVVDEEMVSAIIADILAKA
jgi:SPP1 gp7 family putative phage head morphogenesis protein